LKFAAIGDNGTGDRPQYEIAEQMTRLHATFPFDLVIMLGDNMYGSQHPADFVKKFEMPYAPLLSAGVKFQASLGNHDRAENVSYKPFNMNGERYYTYVRNNARFFALDSTRMDDEQLAWIDASLQKATEEWKICYFHHPLYSNAQRHGASVDLRVRLEPIFVKHGVNVVFSGHDHVYERVKPQKGIHYFVSGAAGQLRRGNMNRSEQTAAYFDQDQSFMLVEIVGSQLYFQAVSRTGMTVDSGVIPRQGTTAGARPQEPAEVGRRR
jgi:3',5'-cyclic AMP phosphodiesterase CpdA